MNPEPKKSLGQHWLHDEASLDAICAAAEVSPRDVIIEIGPGLGTLTKKLVKRAQKVIAIEFDHELALTLHKRVSAQNLEIVEADILKYNLSALPSGYKIVANIPYYLTSNLLRILCESTNPPQTAVLLIQKEVAERICSCPGSMSLLSVSVQLYCEVSLDVEVPAELFTPPPKVDSQVIVLAWRKEPLFNELDTKRFFKIVKAGFSERRKKLRSSLSGGLRISKDQADELLARAGIDGNLRAQNLSLEDWYEIYKVY